jgi:hypothetical protein
MKLANNLQQCATATVKVTLASRRCETTKQNIRRNHLPIVGRAEIDQGLTTLMLSQLFGMLSVYIISTAQYHQCYITFVSA